MPNATSQDRAVNSFAIAVALAFIALLTSFWSASSWARSVAFIAVAVSCTGLILSMLAQARDRFAPPPTPTRDWVIDLSDSQLHQMLINAQLDLARLNGIQGVSIARIKTVTMIDRLEAEQQRRDRIASVSRSLPRPH